MIVNKHVTHTEWSDPDDAPELTDEWFDAADIKIGEKIIRRGRPRGTTKSQVTLRLDRDILDHFKAGGPGWQSRINAALRREADRAA